MIEKEIRGLIINIPIFFLEKYDQIQSIRPADDQNRFESFFHAINVFCFDKKEENYMIHLHFSK